jgi:hypothetical protein
MRTPPHRHVRRVHSKPPVGVSVRAPVSIQARRVWALPYARQLACLGVALVLALLLVSVSALLVGPDALQAGKGAAAQRETLRLAQAAGAGAGAPRSFLVPAAAAGGGAPPAPVAAAAAPPPGGAAPARAFVAAPVAQAQQAAAAQPPPPPATRARAGKRRVYFCLSAGHSGEGFLTELLKVSSEVTVDREAFPSLLDFAGIMHLGREATFKPRREAKVPSLEARLAATQPLHYADINHMFSKSQVDVVMDYFSTRQDEYEVHLITLRRWLPETLQYWLLEDVWDPASMGQYVGGEYTLFHKPFARLPPLQPAYAAEDSVGLILGYLVDMELQLAEVRRAYPWAVYHQLRYEDLRAKNGTARTLAALDLRITNHLDLLRFEGSAVDDPLSWKDAKLRETPAAYFEAQTELFLRAYAAKGVPLPPLPHLARLVPCETLGVAPGEVAGFEASSRSEGAEGEPVDGNVAVAAGPWVLGSAAWAEAGGDAHATQRHTRPTRFLPAAVAGTKTSRLGSAALGEPFSSLLCGAPHAPMSAEAAMAVRSTVVLSRNRAGPGANSVEERSLPAFLTKERERWELVVKDFTRKQLEYEKYKNK